MRERFAQGNGSRNPNGPPAGDAHRKPQRLEGKCVRGLEGMPGRIMIRRTPAPTAGATVTKCAFAIALLAAMGCLLLPAAKIYAESANSDFKAGLAAEARENYDTAFDDYQKALKKSPTDPRFKIALARIRVTASAAHIANGRKLFDTGDMQGALVEFLHASEIDPSNEAARQEIARVHQKQGQVQPGEVGLPEPANEEQELQGMGAPADLKPITNEPLSLHMAEDAKVVYQAVGKAAGINVLFDPSYNSKRIQVDLNNVSLLDALRIVSVLSNTFWRPVTNNTVFVAENTRTKRQELDEQAVQTFYLTNAWQQNDLNDVQTALRSVMPNAKFYGVQSQNAIVARGTPDELLLAEKLIHDVDKARGEVVVDIAVLEVSKNWERNLGISWPSSVGVTLQPSCAASNSCGTSSSSNNSGSGTGNGTGSGSSNTLNPTLYDLAHLKATDFAMSVGSATLNLLLTDNNTKVLQSPRIRATDGQKATMKIGSRIPIATGSYQTGAATALVSSLVNTQFQYQDVGVNIEMTPSVHYDHDVTLNMNITVSTQSGSQTISGVTEPIISQRVINQVIRLREGEASILGGIQNNQDQQNWNGIPGLSAIPILKYVFGSKDHIVQDDDIVFVVVPHIVRSQNLDQANLRMVDTGSGQSIDLRRTDLESAAAPPPTGAARLQPGQQANPVTGSVPGQSAIVAAPEMLSQLRAEAAANTAVNPNAPQNPAQAGAQTANAATAANNMQAAQSATAQTPIPIQTPPNSAGTSFLLNVPPGPMTPGATFKVPVVLNSGVDVSSAALQIQYDPSKLTLVNVRVGDLLTRDGQAAQPVYKDAPQGNLTLGISRPPGSAGVTGTGVVCILSFAAKSSGPSSLAIVHASVVNSAQQQQQLAVQSPPTNILVK